MGGVILDVGEGQEEGVGGEGEEDEEGGKGDFYARPIGSPGTNDCLLYHWR